MDDADKRTGEELDLDVNGFSYDPLHNLGMRPLQHVTEEQARKVGMHSLVPRNKLVAERQDRRFLR